MGLFDIFKPKKPLIESRKIRLIELEAWLETQKKDIQEKEKNFYSLIKNRVSNVINFLEENQRILEKVNLNEKKIEEKIRLVVKENLYYYSVNLRRLIENLKDLNNEEPSNNLIEKINTLFFNFEKKSHMNFEKATFLIGKEMEAVKLTIDNFFKDLKNIIDENKDILEKSKIISLADNKVSELNNIKKTKQEIINNIEEDKKKVADSEDNINQITKNITKLKKSKEYLEERKKQANFEFKKQEIKRTFYALKNLIDFKSLASIFHSDEKKMRKIKEYADDFEQSIQFPEILLEMMKEASLETQVFSEKIKKLLESKKQLDSINPESYQIQENNIKDLENEIKRLTSHIISFNESRLREMRKQDRFDELENKLISEIKTNLEKINVELTI